MATPAWDPTVSIPGPFAPDGSRFVARVDRSPEANELADYIVQHRGELVVLHGETGTGRSTLIDFWLVDALKARGQTVATGQCKPTVPERLRQAGTSIAFAEALARDGVVIIDDFDRVFDLPRDEQRAQVDAFFAARAAAPAATVVVVSDSQHLNDVYALASHEVGATAAIREIPATPLDEALRRLEHDAPNGVHYGEEFLAAVCEECERMLPIDNDSRASATLRSAMGIRRAPSRTEWTATFDLAAIIHRFVAGPNGLRRAKDANDLAALDGVRGLLRTQLVERLAAVNERRAGDGIIAQAILEELFVSTRNGTTDDLSALGVAVGIDQPELDAVVNRCVDSGLLRRTRVGRIKPIPFQLLTIIEDDLSGQAPKIDDAQRIAADGAREWMRHGTLLPLQRFLDVHAARRYIRADDSQARFLLQCALLHDPSAPAGAAAYWLRRIVDRDDAENTLSRALIHDTPHVRARAANLIAEFKDDEARDQLVDCSLRDPSAEVRREAVSSLRAMCTPAVERKLLAEAEAPGSRYRQSAIEALAMFRDDDVARTLVRIVRDAPADSPLRSAVMETLVSIQTAASVDALLSLAMEQSDTAVRDDASRAIARCSDRTLIERVYANLHAFPGGAISAWAVVATIFGQLLLLPIAAAVAAILSAAGAIAWLPVMLLLAPLSGLITRAIMRPVVRDGVPLRSKRGVFAVLTFLFNTVTFFPILHGLAHFAAGMRRLALLLIGLELLGIVFVLQVSPVLGAVPHLSWLSNVYMGVGVALIVLTYFYDVIAVFLRSIAFRQTREISDRRTAVYRRLFEQDIPVRVAFDALATDNGETRKRFDTLVRKYGTLAPSATLVSLLAHHAVNVRAAARRALIHRTNDDVAPTMEAAWSSVDPEFRGQVLRVLYRRPTERAVDMLERLEAHLTLRQRVFSAYARATYQVRMWPVSVRVATVTLLPTLLVLLYSGIETLRNPAWAPLMTLKQSSSIVGDSQRVKTIRYVADAYPNESASDLYRLFVDEKRSASDDETAALMIALSGMTLTPPTDSGFRVRFMSVFGNQVSDTAGEFSLYADDRGFQRSLNVLRAATVSPDTAIAGAALAQLTRFIRDPRAKPSRSTATGKGSTDRVKQAIHAIGKMGFPRALRILDDMLTAQRSAGSDVTVGDVRDALKAELDRVSREQLTKISDTDDVGRTALLDSLSRLENKPTRVIKELATLVFADSTQRARCGNEADETCRKRLQALQDIKDNPESQFAYYDLKGHYEENGNYAGEDSAFHSLSVANPNVIWPKVILAEIQHDHASLSNVAAFQTAYSDFVAIRKLASYRALEQSQPKAYSSLEAEFAEMAMTVGRRAEPDSIAQYFLQKSVTDTTYRFNSVLFAYLGHAIDHAPDAAGWLAQLDTVVSRLPSGFNNGWVYPGTRDYVQRMAQPESLRSALLLLLREGPWYARDSATAIIRTNRAALNGGVRNFRPSGTRPMN